jgi:zinc transporter
MTGVASGPRRSSSLPVPSLILRKGGGDAEPTLHGLIWAYRFDEDGRAAAYAPSASQGLGKPSGRFFWLHLDLIDARNHGWCRQQEVIPEKATAFFLGDESGLRLDHAEGVLYGNLSDMAENLDGQSTRRSQLRFAMGERWLLTGRRHPLHGVHAAKEKIDSGATAGCPAALLEIIVGTAIDGIEALCHALSGEMDSAEDRVIGRKLPEGDAGLGGIRRRAVKLHRDLSSHHTLFRRFAQYGAELKFPDEACATAGAIVQRIDSLHAEVHAIQERARLLQDEITSRRDADMNTSLYVLTMLSTLLLPPTLLFGLFGVNTGGMPFVESPYGFLLTLLLGFAASGAVYWLLNRSRLNR